jgi:hypothetical protein
MIRLLPLLALFFWSCSKNETKEEEQLLMAYEWIVTASTIDPGWMHPQDSVLIVDLLAAGEACRRDDYYSFNRNGVYIHHNGTLRCGNEADQSTSSWALSRNQGKLWLSIAGTPYYEVEITSIQAGSMEWFIPFFAMGDGISRTARLSLTSK